MDTAPWLCHQTRRRSVSKIKNKDFTFRGRTAFKTTLYMSVLFKARQQCLFVFQFLTKMPTCFPWWCSDAGLISIPVFYYYATNMLKVPCEVSQSNTPACWWCTSSCSSAFHCCWCRRLQTDGMQLWAYCHRIGHRTTSALLCKRKLGKNSSDLSGPDAQVHESIMSLCECVRGLIVRVCTTVIGVMVIRWTDNH